MAAATISEADMIDVLPVPSKRAEKLPSSGPRPGADVA